MYPPRKFRLVAALICITGIRAAGQAQNPADASAQQNPPAPAIGQAGISVMTPENPPLSALDSAALEPNLHPRSMLVGGVEASESIDTNLYGTNNDVNWVTRLLGGLNMQRLWSRYDFAAAYVGGIGIYPQNSTEIHNLQELQAQQAVSWKTGQLTVRDSFSYLPEGSFGYGSYGGTPGFELGLGGLGSAEGIIGVGSGGYGILGTAQLGSLGQTPRITNVGIVDVVQGLSPRSAVTAAASFGVVHFMGGNPYGFINSNEASAQAGYSHALNRRDQVALVYAYRGFFYPSVNSGQGNDTQSQSYNFSSNVIQALYGHRVSGRLDFVVGAGPQWTTLPSNPATGQVGGTQLSASGRATVHYLWPKTGASLTFEKFDTSGSGFFAGSDATTVRASVARELARRWHGTLDFGYAHNRRLQVVTEGAQASSFDHFFLGVGVRHEFNRNFGAFLAYQYNYQILNDVTCATGSTIYCATNTDRNVVTFGASWHFRPIRLD